MAVARECSFQKDTTTLMESRWHSDTEVAGQGQKHRDGGNAWIYCCRATDTLLLRRLNYIKYFLV